MQKTKFKKWEDYFEHKGLDPKAMPDVSMLPVQYHKPLIAQYKLEVIIEVENDGWVADYTNHNQIKYSPWFIVKADEKRKSGFGLSYGDYDGWMSVTDVGVRLSMKDVATVEAVANQFIDLYEDWCTV